MNKPTKALFLNLAFNVFFWVVLFTFILAVRYYDIGNIAFVQKDIDIPLVRIWGNGIIGGFLVGIPFTFLEQFMKQRGLYEFSLARIMFNRTLVQSVMTGLVMLLISIVNFRLDIKNEVIDPEITRFTKYIFSPTIQFLFIGAVFGNIILSIFRTLQLKTGEETFYQLLFGKYSPSQEENRAFLFLDLKSSTSIAERLGHANYSYFIQDCFKDLHPAVVEYHAMVYQYVGDEAVLTWHSEMAIKNSNFLKLFFAFEQQLRDRRDYYLKRYGVAPEFKAGLNMGPVMAAEVGVVRREIAYHSDVLNTAARVQEKCNEKNASLLITEDVVKCLEPNHGFSLEEKGEILLRGKRHHIRIFQVRQNPLNLIKTP
jgi:adenylate cyclase